MNSITSNPTAAQAIARHTIEERVRAAEERRIARAIRADRRAARRSPLSQPTELRPPWWWAFRVLRPAH